MAVPQPIPDGTACHDEEQSRPRYERVEGARLGAQIRANRGIEELRILHGEEKAHESQHDGEQSRTVPCRKQCPHGAREHNRQEQNDARRVVHYVCPSRQRQHEERDEIPGTNTHRQLSASAAAKAAMVTAQIDDRKMMAGDVEAFAQVESMRIEALHAGIQMQLTAAEPAGV